MGDHTETVELDYDPKVITFSDLLNLFWKNHNPATRSSRQYMSAIFYHNEEQKEKAQNTKAEQQKHSAQPITTVIAQLDAFYDAEDYHQKYMLRQQRPLLKSLGLSDSELIPSHVAARLNGYVGGNGTLEAFNEECVKLGLSQEQAEMVRRRLHRSH